MRYHVAVGLSLQVKERALRIGFDLAGIAPLAAWHDLEYSRRWVERGFGGEMRYLQNPKREDPRRLLASAQSVVCVGLVYNEPLPYSTEARIGKSEVESRGKTSPNPDSGTCHLSLATCHSSHAGPRAWISRYAWGRDYHHIVRARLEALRAEIEKLAPGAETRVDVDTGPIVERAFARLSGIGWMGKNTCLINQQKGSWFLLGVVLTSLALEPDLPAPDRCGSCTRCIEACPTDALIEPYVMNASRCIAYLNIELKGSIPAEFRTAMGTNVFGCDICQDVCPWNGTSQKSEIRGQKGTGKSATAATTTHPEFRPMQVGLEFQSPDPKSPVPGPEDNRQSANANRQSSFPDTRLPIPDSRSFSLFNPSLESLAAMTEEDFKHAFRDSPIKRAKYRGWLRNLCVAMGNSGDARFVPKLKELAQHFDPVVREQALWSLGQLQ
jgi:epoxyqueuosine reductase